MRQTLPKAERLHGRKRIDPLFVRGSSSVGTFYLFPFRVLYLRERPPTGGPAPAAPPAILISVSKRTFKHAVDRNWLRRRVREAYRLHKALLFAPPTAGPPLPAPHSIAFLYTAKRKISFEEIEKGMKLVLHRLAQSA